MSKRALAAVMAIFAFQANAEEVVPMKMVSSPPTGVTGMPIAQDQYIPVHIASIDGSIVHLEIAESVESRDRSNRLSSGQPIEGILMQVNPGYTRVAVCIQSIGKTETVYVPYGPQYPHEGCIGQLSGAAGRSGIHLDRLKPGTRATVVLNGDLYTATSRP